MQSFFDDPETGLIRVKDHAHNFESCVEVLCRSSMAHGLQDVPIPEKLSHAAAWIRDIAPSAKSQEIPTNE